MEDQWKNERSIMNITWSLRNCMSFGSDDNLDRLSLASTTECSVVIFYI